ncbi:MAG: hypothetical protein ACHQ4H_09700 [Ktedonobacterales bacterium]|jgi:hypothetical protein
MVALWCLCGNSLAAQDDFAFSSHFFASADWQLSGEQILDALTRLLEGGDAEDHDGKIAAGGGDGATGALYECDRCGRLWMRLPEGHFVT